MFHSISAEKNGGRPKDIRLRYGLDTEQVPICHNFDLAFSWTIHGFDTALAWRSYGSSTPFIKRHEAIQHL